MANSVTDVSIGCRVSLNVTQNCPYILHMKNCSDLNLGGSLCIFTFLSFPRLWALSIFIYLLNGFDFDLFLFWISDTEN